MLRNQDSLDVVPPLSPPLDSNSAVAPSEVAVAAFAHRLISAFRNHPHLNNVMTHISFGRWDRIETALIAIFSPATNVTTLSPLAWNLVELLWAERGVSGRIAKPFLLKRCKTSSTTAAAYFTNRLAELEAEQSRLRLG